MIEPITRIDLSYAPHRRPPYRLVFWREGIRDHYVRARFELVMKLIRALPQSGYLVPCCDGWWWAPDHANPTAFGTPPDLITTIGKVIDVYASDYGVQEVGGDPLEEAMLELSEALKEAV